MPGRRRKISEIITNTQKNLITNHFTSFSLSLARHNGGDGHAELGAAGVRDGGLEGGAGAVQGTRAKHSSGLTGGLRGGETKRLVSGTVIGQGQTADGNLTNPGQSAIQQLLQNFQLGKRAQN